VTFELIDPPAAHGYVAIRDVTWHWEYRLGPHHAWHRFDTTRHRLYAMLGVPTAPWHQAPLNTQLPWTDVLDYACRWAEGAASADMAAALVTQAVYALGPSIVTYVVLAAAARITAFPISTALILSSGCAVASAIPKEGDTPPARCCWRSSDQETMMQPLEDEAA